MSWKQRLLELALAGGLITGGLGCGDSMGHVPACNANPDPCCREPDGTECHDAKAACAARNGVYAGPFVCLGPDGGNLDDTDGGPDGGGLQNP